MESQEKGVRKMNGCKIICPYCKKKFYSVSKFDIHLQVCEKRKNWRGKRKRWEIDLQGGGKKK